MEDPQNVKEVNTVSAVENSKQNSNTDHKMVTEITGLDDLISVAENITLYTNISSENASRLVTVLPTLKKLKNMIGLTKIKNQIVNQVIYYIQRFNDVNQDMLHTCIEGDPGCGKTSLGRILGEIYCRLGILSTDKFNIVKRSDLIAGYLGQTAIKTQKVLDESKGGVLFIDEAYSLGNQEEKDFFSKECIDTINRFLTENKQDFVCIIAGYRSSLKECFFSVNPGLERRFPWRYTIEPYSATELLEIFKLQVKLNRYILTEDALDSTFFHTNKEFFKNAGGDTETFFSKCKIIHSNRVLFLPRRFQKILTKSDISNALKQVKDTDKTDAISSLHIYL